MRFEVLAAFSLLGPRLDQQDAAYSAGSHAIVADGVGGEPHGAETALEATKIFLRGFNDRAARRWYNGTSRGCTTIARVTVDCGIATVDHCGDSRVTLIREGSVVHSTTDHCLTPGSNVLTRHMARNRIVNPDTAFWIVKHGDILVLTTDGVHDYVPEWEGVASNDPQSLEALTRMHTGDNATALVLRVNGERVKFIP